MFFILFGVRSSKLKERKLNANTNCPNCEISKRYTIRGSASYFHLFWIPFIPLKKRIRISCDNCNKTYQEESITSKLKDSLKLVSIKRPIWHYLGLFIILGFFVTTNVIGLIELKEEADFEEQAQLKIELGKQNFNSDKDKIQINPSFSSDSISHTINSNLEFSKYKLDINKVGFFSKINKNKLLVLININTSTQLSLFSYCSLVKDVKTILLNRYYDKIEHTYIAIYNDDKLEILDTPNHPYALEYSTRYPMETFYEEGYVFFINKTKDLSKKQAFLSKYHEKHIEKRIIDSIGIERLWYKISHKFNFKFKHKPTEMPKYYKYGFFVETNNAFPNELELLLKFHNGEGPFFSKNSMLSNSSRLYQKYINTEFNKLYDSINSASETLPLKVCPNWFPFYEDNKYVYALDFSPNIKGNVGQVISIDSENGNTFVARNLLDFLKLYYDEKVPTDIDRWVN